jgi:hypothetical protein
MRSARSRGTWDDRPTHGPTVLTGVPSLDAIAMDPTLAIDLPPLAKRELAMRAVIALAALVPQWEVLSIPSTPQADEVLDLEEAARRLNMPVGTLRNRTTREPYLSLRISNGTRYVRFSAVRIAAYLGGEQLGSTRTSLGPPQRRKGQVGCDPLPSTFRPPGKGGATS